LSSPMKSALVLFLVLVSPAPILAAEFQVQAVTTCVSPDSSLETLQGFLEAAESSLYINAYTFTNQDLAESVVDARKRGVDVRVMVEESPVGGIPEEERYVLNMFLASGIPVFLSSGPDWRFNHGKYAVADMARVFISTENYGYSGYPREGLSGNRGWCLEIEDPGVSGYFAGLFFRDLGNAQRLEAPLPGAEAPAGSGFRDYPAEFESADYRGSFRVVTVLAPEDALEEIVGLIESARESVYAEQFYAYTYWGKGATGSPEETPNLFLEALVDAARRGCRVRLLLDDTWYNVERDDPRSNYYAVRYLNELARREGLDLEARLMDSRAAGLEKLHAKGVVVDGKAVLVSSVNWNEHSPTRNREVGVIVYGEPAQYYARVFEEDWSSGQGDDDKKTEIVIGVLLVSFTLGYVVRKRTV